MPVTAENWLEAQYSVLGSALIDERVVPLVMSRTDENDYSGGCRNVYRAMRRLFDRGMTVDPISVNNEIGQEYRPFLTELMEITPTAANVEHYVQICREQSRLTAIRDIGHQLCVSETMGDARTLLEKANAHATAGQPQKSMPMGDCLRDFMQRMEQIPTYLKWPIDKIGDKLHVKGGKICLIAAEPSVGKTAFALQCSCYWAKTIDVGFFSYETDAETVTDRIVASAAAVSLENIQTRNLTTNQWDKLASAASKLSERRLTIEPASGLTVSDIRAKVIEKGYQLIVIDYLQLIPGKGSTRYEQVTNVSIALHALATSLGVTVFALSQVSRSEDDRQPRNSDLRESGQLEQDADVIMFLKHRKRSRPKGPRMLYVTKNKEGELFQINLAFDGPTQTFRYISELKASVEDTAEETDNDNNAEKRNSKDKASNNLPLRGQMELLPDDYKVPF